MFRVLKCQLKMLGFANILVVFVKIIQNDLPVEIDAREGTRTVAVAEAMIRSAAENQIVKVDYNF